MNTREQTTRTATAYVVTFPSEGGGLGHTSLYVAGSDGSFIQRSFFPSTRKKQHIIHNLLLGMFPVYGFITKGLSADVRYERGAPESIQKIENLDYEAMLKENREFNAKLHNGTHFFSMRYNGVINPLHWLLRMGNVVYNYVQKTEFDPFAFSFEDPIIAFPTKKISENGQEKISFGNCTDAVDRSLQAGGLQLKQSSENWFLAKFFAGGHTPKKYKEDIDLSGGMELIGTHEELPEQIKIAVENGRKIYNDRDLDQEKLDWERRARLRGYESHM